MFYDSARFKEMFKQKKEEFERRNPKLGILERTCYVEGLNDGITLAAEILSEKEDG